MRKGQKIVENNRKKIEKIRENSLEISERFIRILYRNF